MDYLWSPWRYQYVSAAQPSRGCIFCDKAAEGNDRDNLILYRAANNFVLLNLYPYSTGHLMVAPYAHLGTLEDADEATVTEMMRLTRRAQAVLGDVYSAPGFNIGMNIGSCAGAGVAGHIHMHVLPRWPGDVNFMTAVAESRVIPEDLSTTFEKLTRAFATAA
jgi:ATP adenylyltransferase